MPNLLSGVGAAFANIFSTLLSYALPLLAVAILGLVVAITAVNFILGLFGFKLGLAEKFRENLRRKLKQSKKPFPFAIKSRNRDTGLKADAKSPWTSPADWSHVDQDMLFDGEQIDADLAYFIAVDFSGKTADVDVSDFEERASSVASNFESYFPTLGSISGLASASNVSDMEKKNLLYHAANVVALKHKVLSENAQEWAKQYGDGMASGPVKFVA